MSKIVNAVAQQQAGILGVDHVGINVPDMDEAIRFFSDVLGFVAVTQLGPIPLDDAWKQANRMQSGTGAVTIKMVRTGTGANIELFSYADNKGSQQHPGGDDIGAAHIAFYTADIHAAVSYLRSKGVKVLGDPFLMPSGDTEGESWVYFETPWGAKMELVSYPNGKGYERNSPATVLWSPKDGITPVTPAPVIELSVPAMQALVEQHLQLWNERDASRRSELLKQVYADNVEMVDRHFVAVGHAAINGFVNGLQEKNPAFRFSHVRPVDIHHHIARLYWQVGTPEKPAAVTGMDLFVFEQGKVAHLYVFVDSNE